MRKRLFDEIITSAQLLVKALTKRAKQLTMNYEL